MPGNYSKVYTAVDGEEITAARWNAEHDNHINNAIPASIDDYSADVSTMQSTADPYPAGAESLATTLAGEHQRERYQLLELLKRFGKTRAETKWYVDFPFAFGIKGSDIASAAAITIPNDGNYYHVTGTTGITSIAALGIGSRVTLVFDGAVTLTHHATDLILSGANNITTEAGDVFDFVEYAAGDWRLVSSSRGPKVTAWTSYTPTGAWSTNTTYAGKYRRVGDNLEVDMTISLSGAPTTASLTANLPSGLVIDTAKMSGPGSEAIVGTGVISDATGPLFASTVLYSSTTAVAIRYHAVSGSQVEINGVNATTPVTFATGDKIIVRYSVPISGWSVL